tara:strand:- start:43 stop:234 length:192 start_codon:yes stop_codon:yes gene_type:complete
VVKVSDENPTINSNCNASVHNGSNGRNGRWISSPEGDIQLNELATKKNMLLELDHQKVILSLI